MVKPKAKTLQEHMGFTDPDLKTPGHDATMLWLDDEVKRSLADWLKVGDWTDTDRSHGLSLPNVPDVKVIKTIWEQPVVTGRDYTVGFLDLTVCYKQQAIGWSEPVSGGTRTYSVSWYDDKAFFEVKTSIPSLGDLLRQLGHYRQYLKKQSWDPDPKIFVVCPDARFADKIREQGYGFIQCPDLGAKVSGHSRDERWLFGAPSH